MIGDEIRIVREARGLTQQQVSDLCGLSRSTITAIESGRNYPSLTALEALTTCLNFTLTITPSDTVVDY